MKKRIKRVKKSRIVPDKYKGAYEKKLRNLEKKVKSERKQIIAVIKNANLEQLNLTDFHYV